MLSNIMKLDFRYLKIIHILHPGYLLKITRYILKMKMQMKKKNRRYRYNISRPRSRHGYK